MPDITVLAIVGAVWAALLVLAWAMFVAAARSDRQDDRIHQDVPERRPTIVADTGAIRDHLRKALELVHAEQLVVTVGIDGRSAVLAATRSVVEARPGRSPEAAVPVWVGARRVATLEATRRPGEPRFDAADTLMLRRVADGVGRSLQIERPSVSVPVRAPSAMA
jgi:hypothetical protein